MTDELKAAYERLEEAIHDVCELQGFEGIPIEWVIVAAFQRYTDAGASITQVGTLLPDGGEHVPRHRAIGLLGWGLTANRAKVAQDVA